MTHPSGAGNFLSSFEVLAHDATRMSPHATDIRRTQRHDDTIVVINAQLLRSTRL
ncbi:MAG: hypothetical protein JSR74_07060 [Proteobacteria bacterium]|nr:hypothetical protein [Pseudomonadota bacterium]